MALTGRHALRVSDVIPLEHVVEGTREFFLGAHCTGTAWLGAAPTPGLGLLGRGFGVRRFRRGSG